MHNLDIGPPTVTSSGCGFGTEGVPWKYVSRTFSVPGRKTENAYRLAERICSSEDSFLDIIFIKEQVSIFKTVTYFKVDGREDHIDRYFIGEIDGLVEIKDLGKLFEVLN